jgi:hypothetical protein
MAWWMEVTLQSLYTKMTNDQKPKSESDFYLLLAQINERTSADYSGHSPNQSEILIFFSGSLESQASWDIAFCERMTVIFLRSMS